MKSLVQFLTKVSEYLTVIFITLKMAKVIDMKWIWVLSPTWICAIVLILGVIVGAKIKVMLMRR